MQPLISPHVFNNIFFYKYASLWITIINWFSLSLWWSFASLGTCELQLGTDPMFADNSVLLDVQETCVSPLLIGPHFTWFMQIAKFVVMICNY